MGYLLIYFIIKNLGCYAHPTITYIFAGDHAQARATGKELSFKGCLDYLDMYIAKNV